MAFGGSRATRIRFGALAVVFSVFAAALVSPLTDDVASADPPPYELVADSVGNAAGLVAPDLAGDGSFTVYGCGSIVLFEPEPCEGELHLFDHGGGSDVVLADEAAVPDRDSLIEAAERLGAAVELAPVARPDGTPRHDPELLAAAYDRIFRMHGRIGPWR